jgi:hypothetical protein
MTLTPRILTVINNQVDWGRECYRFKEGEIIDASGMLVKWGAAYGAKFPLTIYSLPKEKQAVKPPKKPLPAKPEKIYSGPSIKVAYQKILSDFGTTPEEINKSGRKRDHTLLIKITAARVLHHHLRINPRRIGDVMGKDRTTIMYYCGIVAEPGHPYLDGLPDAIQSAVKGINGLIKKEHASIIRGYKKQPPSDALHCMAVLKSEMVPFHLERHSVQKIGGQWISSIRHTPIEKRAVAWCYEDG